MAGRRLAPLLRDAVARRCAVRGWERWIDPLCAWLQDFLRLPLGAADAPASPLAGLDTWVAEMEFWIAVHRVDLPALDALVRRHTLGGAERPPLQAGQLNGMLKGFIDLVVEHDGRYYVVDYKVQLARPRRRGLHARRDGRRDPRQPRYELQYVLYLLACTACSGCACPITTTTRTSAGALSLPARQPWARRGIHAERPPRALIDALDRLFARRTTPEAA